MSALLQTQIEQTPAETVTIDTILYRGVDTVMPESGLRRLLESGPVRLYLGIDPTSPNLHIGHMVPLRKLRQLQILGHNVILLFGTFTGMIGDPTDKSAARVRLTQAQIDRNVSTYREQAGKILDLSPDAPNPIEVVYNHEWLSKLNFMDVVELASNFTVNELITRSTYKGRLDAGVPLYLHEFFYSLMQGYDSVALGVKLEVGGKDQLTNMLTGRTLMKVMADTEKWVMGLKLIEDPNGAKMGKTSGNVVNIMEQPEVIYEAMMTWPDTTIALGLELLTTVPFEIVEAVGKEMELISEGKSQVNPMEIKEGLAWRVVSELNGSSEADFARKVFDLVKRKKQLPPRIITLQVPSDTVLSVALVASGLVADENEAQSKLSQNAIRLNGKAVSKNVRLPLGENIVEIGKRSIKNVRKVVVA